LRRNGVRREEGLGGDGGEGVVWVRGGGGGGSVGLREGFLCRMVGVGGRCLRRVCDGEKVVEGG